MFCLYSTPLTEGYQTKIPLYDLKNELMKLILHLSNLFMALEGYW